MRNTTTYPAYFTRNDYKIESDEVVEAKIAALLRAMTPTEKFSMVAGSIEPAEKGKVGNAGYQWGCPRLGIPESLLYDGPAGVTGILETTGIPQPALLGCTWDEQSAYNFGKIAAEENAASSGNYQLSPQVDTIHSPHFMRNKDMKSEDSYLVSRLSVAETKGTKDQNVIATIKHFTVANSFGSSMFDMPDVQVDEQTLHEQYLRPFEDTIKLGNALALMNSYNSVNGNYCSASKWLLKDILRDQWQFKGVLMSDWGSVHEYCLNKGLDLEMPLPAYQNADRIIKSMVKGETTMDDVDLAVRHSLYALGKIGMLSLVELDENGEVKEDLNHPLPIQCEWRFEEEVAGGMFERHEEMAREIVAKGITLLKNDGTLPLTSIDESGDTVLIGLSTKVPVAGEMQERSYGRLCRMKTAEEAFEQVTGKKVPAYIGVDYLGEVIPADALYQDAACTVLGLKRTYGVTQEDRDKAPMVAGIGGGGAALAMFAATDEDGERVRIGLGDWNSHADTPAGVIGELCCVDSTLDFSTKSKTYLNGPDGNAFHEHGNYTWSGYLKAPETGEFNLKLCSIGGPARFLINIDGEWKEIARITTRESTQWPWDNVVCTETGMAYNGNRYQLEKGKSYQIIAYAEHDVQKKDLQIQIRWIPPAKKQKDHAEAVQAAAKAKNIVFYAVNAKDNKRFEFGAGAAPEPRDIGLQPDQKALLTDVIAAKAKDARITVVVQTSNAVAVGEWCDKVNAIVTGYMAGQEEAPVMAEILTGVRNPTGKLAQTWPKTSADTPLSDTQDHFLTREYGKKIDGKNILQLTEGIFWGYRWYDRFDVEPAFCFGHGLSYTTYTYANAKVEPKGATFEVTVDVTNTGTVTGDEIVQLYLGPASDIPAYVQMAEKQLCGFTRVEGIAPGETRTVSVEVDERSLSYWDVGAVLKTRADGTRDKWHRTTGGRMLYVAASSRDIRAQLTILL